MKLLHCLNSPRIGGIERVVIDLAIAQQKQGIEVSIMLDTRDGHFYKYLLKHQISVFDSNIKGSLDFNPKTFKTLRMHFQTFDIVHLHSFSPIRSLAAPKDKTVYTIHGLSKDIRREHFLKRNIREWMKKRLLNRVAYFTANSEYTLRLAKTHYGLDRVSRKAILNGISFSSVGTDKRKSNQNVFKIGLVTRFTPRKRVDRLIKAFHIYIINGGTGRLTLVGDGETFPAIQQQIQQLDLEESVEMTGYKSDVQKYYEHFDICVFPSEQEPFGLVGVEAYRNGKPVLAFQDSGGLKEVIDPLEPDNVVIDEQEMAERMMFYFDNPREIPDNAEKRKAYARENFSIERMERDYFNVYKEVLGKS